MKILHVSNFGDRHNGRLYWNQCFKISNGFVRNGHNVYNFSDRDKSRSSILNKFNQNSSVQKDLIETIKNFDPDLIVLGHADRVNLNTLDIIRKINKEIRIIEWNVDNLHLDNTKNKLQKRSIYLDGMFSTTADEKISQCLTNNFISFFPNIVDNTIENQKIFEIKQHEKDVFFALSHGVGTGKLRSKNSNKEGSDPRVQFITNLTNNLPGIKFNLFGMMNIQPVWANDFLNEISKCYMGICLQRKPLLKYGLSDRIAQYLGNGLMVFIQNETQYYDILKDKEEAVYFDDVDDLTSKILFYRDNKDKAKSIAKNGHIKIHNTCNEKIVTKYMLDCLAGKKNKDLSSEYHWPINIYR